MKKNGGATIAHWLTTKCPKPWVLDVRDADQRRSLPGVCDPKMYEAWMATYFDTLSEKDRATFAKLEKDETPEDLAVRGFGRRRTSRALYYEWEK